MIYELHLTVNTNNIQQFIKDCKYNDIKPIVIDIQNKESKHVFHDVMTSSKYIGDDNGVLKESKRIEDILTNNGYNVIRTKIEVPPTHPKAIPSDNNYFETHLNIKTTLDKIDELRSIAYSNDCHLSRNIFKKSGNDIHIMMTYRSYELYEDFLNKLTNIKLSLKDYEVDKEIVEFVLYDNNNKHDNKWLN